LDFQIFPKFLQDFYLDGICNINNLRLIKGRFASLGFAGWQGSDIRETDRRPWRQRVIDCMEAIMRERNSNSRIGFQPTAGGGDRFAIVLDFEFLSRPAPPCKQ
jgi:hypothetical protein